MAHAPEGAPDRPMSPQDLRAIGQRLYGSYGWQSKLARALDRDPRVVRRWAAGDTGIPPDTRRRIRQLAADPQQSDARAVIARMADAPGGWSVRREGAWLIAERRDAQGRTLERHRVADEAAMPERPGPARA